ncbi:MAG: L-aspartate oxidase [Cellulophaga sp.]
MNSNTHYLVIGSGIAGLTFAIKMATKFPEKSVTIITKANEDESNTKYAQGGIAIVLDKEKDSFEKHIKDTLKAGDGLCKEEIVAMVVTEGPERLKELLQWGASFDNNQEGNFDLGKEGGHSENRVVHYKDCTGAEIERALLDAVHKLSNITFLTHHLAIDLITEHQLGNTSSKKRSCYGAYVLDQKKEQIITINAAVTILASGGVGCIYGHTTNPSIATGDGIAMGYRAKAKIKDMEFIQFHPTALYSQEIGTSFLISEAVRGFGAYLRNKEGHRFMLDYHERGELASRDIVSQCIDKELKKTKNACVYLDCTHLEMPSFKKHFPTIYNKCKSLHIDTSKDWIPVIPASHYLCGGIEVTANGETSVQQLFACGEVSRTGLHGANRLASNSLLEALVYADRIFKFLASKPVEVKITHIPNWNIKELSFSICQEQLLEYRKKLQQFMRTYAGIVRSNNDLLHAKKLLEQLYAEVDYLYKKSKITTELCELRNMINTSHLIINQSIDRKENKGGYFNSDYS